jgi:hypothetical protein
MLQILLNSVSTRRYRNVIPEIADTVGVSKSTVSREAIEASEAALKQLMERRFDEVDLLILYIDGMKFQDQCVVAAVGVDVQGRKHVLALREGATENAEPPRICSSIWWITGSIPHAGACSSSTVPKRCARPSTQCLARTRPSKDVETINCAMWLGRLPRPQQAQTASLMRADWKMNSQDGMAKFRQIAGWLEHDYPDAAAALLEGLEECFTINRLDIPRSLHRCLATSNIVDNPHFGVRDRTRRVCRWRPGMAARWSAAAFLEIDKSFRKIMGYRELWALKAILDGLQPATRQAVA